MRTDDLNVQRVEVVAAALGELRNELVLVGGCAVGLLMDAPTAPLPRVTYDVDLIAVVTALVEYQQLERRFEAHGFKRDIAPDAPICRWRMREVMVDLMPTDERVLGFSNLWYTEAAASATRCVLPSGTAIQLIAAPAFVATKFEAFHSRGNADVLSSHDLEDIINVVEGRAAFLEDVQATNKILRDYLKQRFAALVSMPYFFDLLPGIVTQDALHVQRLVAVRQRLNALAMV